MPKKLQAEITKTLAELTIDQLQECVWNSLKDDEEAQMAFLVRYGKLSIAEEKSMYRKKITAALQSAKGGRSFLDPYASKKWARGLDQLLIDATESIHEGVYQGPVVLSFLILERTHKLMDRIDDSYGDLSDSIDYALFNLLLVGEDAAALEDKERKLYLKMALEAYRKEYLSDWDWHNKILEFALDLAFDRAELEKVNQHFIDFHGSGEPKYSSNLPLKAELVRRLEGEIAHLVFLRKYQSHWEIKELLVEKLLQAQSYEEAQKVCKEALKEDSVYQHHKVNWQKYLVKIASLQGDNSLALTESRTLFLSSSSFEVDQYRELKGWVEPKDWPAVRQELIDYMREDKRWSVPRKLLDFLLKEDLKDEALAQLDSIVHEDFEDLYFLEKYEEALGSEYPEAYVEFYKRTILNFLEHKVGRKYYKAATRYLFRMSHLGTKEAVFAMISDLKQKYAVRSALIEELNRLEARLAL